VKVVSFVDDNRCADVYSKDHGIDRVEPLAVRARMTRIVVVSDRKL
jgi:hypothetical protein